MNATAPRPSSSSKRPILALKRPRQASPPGVVDVAQECKAASNRRHVQAKRRKRREDRQRFDAHPNELIPWLRDLLGEVMGDRQWPPVFYWVYALDDGFSMLYAPPPLAIGVVDEIREWCGCSITRAKTIARRVAANPYYRAMLAMEGAVRFHLDGSEQGAVSDEHAARAVLLLDGRCDASDLQVSAYTTWRQIASERRRYGDDWAKAWFNQLKSVRDKQEAQRRHVAKHSDDLFQYVNELIEVVGHRCLDAEVGNVVAFYRAQRDASLDLARFLDGGAPHYRADAEGDQEGSCSQPESVLETLPAQSN